jgi:hypothetical protein
MSNMSVCHDEVVVADSRNTAASRGPSMDRHMLTDDVIVADAHLGRLSAVSDILRRKTYGDKRIDLVPLTDAGPSFDHHMRTYARSGTDTHLWANDRIGSNDDIFRELNLGIHQCGGMNFHEQ